jgi:hypothetical protein
MSRLFVCLLLLASTINTSAQETSAPPPDLQRLDALFDRTYAWFGSMVDPVTGGVHFSAASASQPGEYPPHLEAASKYVRALEWSEQLDAMPEPLRQDLIQYFQSRQLGPSEDPALAPLAGFFLDPGYADLTPYSNEHRRRDYAIARSTSMSLGSLELLGAEPLHTPPDTSTHPEALAHLQSPEAFERWLRDRRWDRTWTAGGTLLTQAHHIESVPDPELRGALLQTAWRVLDEMQDPETGYWGLLQGDNNDPYILLNGAHKIVQFFRAFDQPVPMAQRLLGTTLREVQREQAIRVTYVYNSSQLVQNLARQDGVTLSDPDRQAFVTRSIDNLGRFARDDGGFSSRPDATHHSRMGPRFDRHVSNADATGLAIRARNSLYELAAGELRPLASAGDPRAFAMSPTHSRSLIGLRPDDDGVVRWRPHQVQLELAYIEVRFDEEAAAGDTVRISYALGDDAPQPLWQTTVPADAEAIRVVPMGNVSAFVPLRSEVRLMFEPADAVSRVVVHVMRDSVVTDAAD